VRQPSFTLYDDGTGICHTNPRPEGEAPLLWTRHGDTIKLSPASHEQMILWIEGLLNDVD